MRGNVRAEYAPGASRSFCKTFPGVDAPAKIHVLPLQTIDVRAGKKRAGHDVHVDLRITALKDFVPLLLREVVSCYFFLIAANNHISS